MSASVLKADREEADALKAHEDYLELCRRKVSDPDTTEAQRQKYERYLRLAEKHVAKIRAPFDARRKADSLVARDIAIKAERQKAMALYSEAPLDTLEAALPTLTGVTLDFVQARIQTLREAIEVERKAEAAKTQAASEAQKFLDDAACARAVGEIAVWVKPYLLTQRLDLAKREKLREFCLAQVVICDKAAKTEKGTDDNGARKSEIAKRMATKFKALAAQLEIVSEESLQRMPDDYWTDHACSPENFSFRTTQERALLRYFTAENYRKFGVKQPLPDAPPPILGSKPPSQSLAGIEARESNATLTQLFMEEKEEARQRELEALKQNNPTAYERLSKDMALGIRGDGPLQRQQRSNLAELKKRNPREYQRLSLLALEPRNFEPATTIYLTPTWVHGTTKKAPDEMWWPHGAPVKPGQIVYDFRMKAWFLAPEPVGTTISWDSKQSGPSDSELEKLEPEVREFWLSKRAEDSQWSQTDDGHFVPQGGASSLFAPPVRVSFLRGDRRVEGSGRDHFRHGHWWTKEEIDKAEGPGWTEVPVVLPPLPKIAKADFIAHERPPSPESIAKLNAPVETVWSKHERKKKEGRERDAAILTSRT